MRNPLFIFLVLILASCTTNHQESHRDESPTNVSTMLDRFIDSLLIENPNALNNDVTRSMMSDTIKARFNRYQGGKLPFLSELPMEYEMCLPYNAYSDFAGQYVVKFSFCDRADDKTTTFQVFTRMDKEQVASLVDNAKYKIDGVFLFYPDNTKDHWFELPSGRGCTDNPRISMTTELDNSQKPFINLGTLILKDVNFNKLSD